VIADAHDRRSVRVGLSLKRKQPTPTIYSTTPSAIPSAASTRWSGQSRSVGTMHPQYSLSLSSVEYQRNQGEGEKASAFPGISGG